MKVRPEFLILTVLANRYIIIAPVQVFSRMILFYGTDGRSASLAIFMNFHFSFRCLVIVPRRYFRNVSSIFEMFCRVIFVFVF